MLTDEEALRKAEGEYMMNGSPEFRAGFTSALAWLRSQREPVAYLSGMFRDVVEGKTDRIPLGADVSFINLQWRGQIPLYLAPQPAIPDGHVIAPAFRGYAVMGAGEYLLDCCPPDEYGPSLVISIATDEEKAGRVVGDLRDPIPGKLIQPEAMAIRIDFLTVAGLDALEQQLRILRADYFTTPEPKSC